MARQFGIVGAAVLLGVVFLAQTTPMYDNDQSVAIPIANGL